MTPTFSKKTKKRVDGTGGVCYIMTVAPMRAAGERKQAPALERRRMYPENYTMQNKLEETLTARCNIVVKVETPSVNETTILLQE